VRFQHLLCRLRKARFIAINWWYLEEPGQEGNQRERQKERDRAAMRPDCKVERGG
jgi:hypothetical protein